MAPAPGPIRFLFDYLSPYAYLAWNRIHALAEAHGRAVEPVPVLLAALLGAGGQKGPAEIPAKRRWVMRDVARTAASLGIPMRPPPSHPFNPLLALRVSSLEMDGAIRRNLIDGLYGATWKTGEGVTDPEVVARIASGAGLDGAAVVRAAGESDAKDRLRRATEAAIGAGAFGVPTMLVGEELFWGFDSFGHLGKYLEGKDVLDQRLVEAWEKLPASASRT